MVQKEYGNTEAKVPRTTGREVDLVPRMQGIKKVLINVSQQCQPARKPANRPLYFAFTMLWPDSLYGNNIIGLQALGKWLLLIMLV
jgi:hypothetical protein